MSEAYVRSLYIEFDSFPKPKIYQSEKILQKDFVKFVNLKNNLTFFSNF